MSLNRRFVCALVVGAFALAATAAAPARSAAGETVLQRTLLAVSNDPALGGNFEFGDVAAQRKLAGVPAGSAGPLGRIWGSIVGVGASLYSSNIVGKYLKIGISPLYVDLALSVGFPPDTAIEARGGVRPAALRAALLALGAKPGTVAGRAGLVWGAEGSLHPNALNSLGVGIGGLGEYDRTVLGADIVVAGRRTAPVADLLGAGDGATFADNPTIVAAADCLGDVIAAYGTDYHGTELAVGVRRPASASGAPVEVICAVPSANAAGADADAAALRSSLSTTSRLGASEILTTISHWAVSEGAAASTRFVRGTLYDRPRQPAGVTFIAFERGDLETLLGLPL
jgi:hypothetical protein